MIILILPFTVNAKVCTKDDIKINSIETVETNGSAIIPPVTVAVVNF